MVRYFTTKPMVELIEQQIDKWQIKTKDVLAGCFGSNSEHKLSFERTIVENRMYYDAKKELQREINDGRNALSVIIDEETIWVNIVSTQSTELILLSHLKYSSVIRRKTKPMLKLS